MFRETASGIVLLENLNLRNGRRSSMLELEDALAAPPELALSMDGACTLTLTIADARRKLLPSPLVAEKSWSQVAGIRFELAQVRKSGDRVTLTYEDGITAALKRRDSKLTIPAGSMTRRGIALRLAEEANVPCTADPAKRRNVARAVERSVGRDKSTSWDVLGDLAEEVKWRRFSTGKRLFFGSDGWLLEDDRPIRLSENTGAVRFIDFDLDVGKRASTATVYFDAEIGTVPPGQLVVLGNELGGAAGRWLVSSARHTLSSTQAVLQLVRERHELREPRASDVGDGGEPDFVPGAGDGTDAGVPTSGARERMVEFALAQRGDAYVWGANGPDAWDCSGLVQGATAAAGRQLTKPSASQATVVAESGTPMSIDAAIRTRGALLFRMSSPYNHVAISLGNGSTIEAMGSAYGVCIGSASGRGWTSAGLWI